MAGSRRDPRLARRHRRPRPDLEQAYADRRARIVAHCARTGCLPAKPNSRNACSRQWAIAEKYKRVWLERSRAVEAPSANKANCCSVMRFSISFPASRPARSRVSRTSSSYKLCAAHCAALSEVTTKRGLGSADWRPWPDARPCPPRAVCAANCGACASQTRRTPAPACRRRRSAFCNDLRRRRNKRRFLAGPNTESTPCCRRQLIDSSRQKPASARSRISTPSHFRRNCPTIRTTSSSAPAAASRFAVRNRAQTNCPPMKMDNGK